MRLSLFSLCLYAGISTALRSNVLMQRPPLRSHLDTTSTSRLADSATRNLRRQAAKIDSSNGRIAAETVRLPLDHWDSSAGTFLNRFWVNEAFYKPGGPVVLFDAGEGNAAGDLGYLVDPDDSVLVQMVRQFNGIGILWEHRYYGASTPVNITHETPASAFEYLTTEQALADVPVFAWNFSRTNFPEQDLTPASTPWVFIGGSYPGMRAAFVRHTYPETIFASYASSAPVQASIDMSFYFEPVWQGMQAYNASNCAADIHAAILEMDDMLDDDEQSLALKEKFFGAGAGDNTNGGFADALAVIFGRWQNYGLKGDRDGPGLGEFCDWISTDPETKTKSDAKGWAAVKGPQFTIDRWASWAPFTKLVNHDMKTKCAGPASNSTALSTADTAGKTDAAAKTCDLALPYYEADSISWTWQYCTQWGFFQSANVGPHQLVSKHNSLQHQQAVCHRQFPDGLESGHLPLWPAVDDVNALYDGWNIRPSNTFWGGAEFDPWRTLSPLSDMWFSPRSKPVQTVPACATADDDEGAAVFGYVLKNGEHCFDLNLSAVGSDVPRSLFIKALTEWLGCFVPGNRRRSNVKTGIRTVQVS
jgi:Serine carboxypeptidase S28